jgi:hypothetical protein
VQRNAINASGSQGDLRLAHQGAGLVHHADGTAFERHVDAEKMILGLVLPRGSLPPTEPVGRDRTMASL